MIIKLFETGSKLIVNMLLAVPATTTASHKYGNTERGLPAIHRDTDKFIRTPIERLGRLGLVTVS